MNALCDWLKVMNGKSIRVIIPIISNTSVGNISEPIVLPQGILIFKIRDKKVTKKSMNLEEAKRQLVNDEKSKILQMYS